MKLKTRNFKFSLFVLSLLMLSVKPALAQDINKHEFIGYTFIDGKKAKDVVVKVFDDNNCFSEYETRSNGKFIFTANCEKHYTLQFEKEGYVTKRMVIKTDNTSDLEYVTKTYKFDVSLLKKEQGVDYGQYDFPIAIIELDKRNMEFTFNKKYTENRLESIATSTNNQIAKN